MSVSTGIKVGNYQRPVNLINIANRDKAVDNNNKQVSKKSFQDIFSREIADNRRLQFSKHAHERLFSRGIKLSEETLNHIADAVDKAELKGSRETLILSDQAAFVVSVKNRTVITAFDRNNLREGIVTSIDSAVII
ncbi:MAG: flagellar protein [FCB group bacterium]|nr:flagellar protein [FCB group bacterium]